MFLKRFGLFVAMFALLILLVPDDGFAQGRRKHGRDKKSEVFVMVMMRATAAGMDGDQGAGTCVAEEAMIAMTAGAIVGLDGITGQQAPLVEPQESNANKGNGAVIR